MAQRIQQIGAPQAAPQVYDPEGTPENPDWSRYPGEYWSSLKPVVEGLKIIANPVKSTAIAGGALVKGKQGVEWVTQAPPITYDYNEGGFGFKPTTEETYDAPAAYTGRKYTLEDYLKGTPEYDLIQSQQDSARNATAQLRQLLDTATLKIGGAYGAAADQGRRTGANINTRGQATGNEIADYYGDAANFASDMSQAGGTAVSGLTGPSSAFQSIYGDSYGTGTGMSEAARSTASLASEDMMAEAQRAAGMGGTASKNLNKMWGTMSIREQQALTNQMNQYRYTATTAYNAAGSKLAVLEGFFNRALAGKDKDEKNRIKKIVGGKTPNDVAVYIDNLEAEFGPVGALEELISRGDIDPLTLGQ